MNDYIKMVIRRPKLALDRIMHLREIVSWATLLDNIFIQQEYRWLYNHIRSDTTLMDIGAFHGETAIYFSMNERIKKIYAIEPSKTSYKHLLKNTQLISRIKPYNFGIGITHTSDTNKDSPLNKDFGNMVFINDFLQGKKNIAIKCDVEGKELEVFPRDAKLDNVYAIEAEFHDTEKLLIKNLKDKGFIIKTIEKHKGILFKEVGMITAYKMQKS